jgi:T-complex protein 1 subunit zeta
MAALQYVNSKAELVRKAQALNLNLTAAKGLQDVLRTNLGPRGTLKMLVGGAGQIKLTKDGNILLKEMQIQHPTAAMIARASTAQDEIVGDGTTSNVLFIGELMRQAERFLGEGVHPRVLADGFDKAREVALRVLQSFKQDKEVDRELLINVARSSLSTKLIPEMARQLTEIVTDAVLAIRQPEKSIDLHMVEIMHMPHKMNSDTRLVKGLVLDHGSRHPDTLTKAKNCYVLCCNINLEYEKTEVNSQFFYNSAEQREKLQASERKMIDERVEKIIALKKKVCDGTDKNFIVINQKGVDPVSLDMLAKENIVALRRAKRRNMERIPLACGGNAVNSADDLTEADLGWAGSFSEISLGDDKFTFLEDVPNTFSVTILIKGQNEHTINQLKDAVRDGLRAVYNTIQDKAVVPGAGAFEIAVSVELKRELKNIKGKARLGADAFADAILVIPRTLAENSGLDSQEVLLKLISEYEQHGVPVGVNINDESPISPASEGIYDNYCVKQQFLQLAPVLAQQLLLVDEVMRAGKQMGGGN